MGDRVSLQFQTDGLKSAILYDHWGGMRTVGQATEYVRRLKADPTLEGEMGPLHRLESDSVMFNFMWWLQKKEAESENPDLYCTHSGYRLTDRVNRDNRGHHIVRCDLPADAKVFLVESQKDGRVFEALGAKSMRGVMEQLDELYYSWLVGDVHPMSWDVVIYAAPACDVGAYSGGYDAMQMSGVMRPGAEPPKVVAGGTYVAPTHVHEHYSWCAKCDVWGDFSGANGEIYGNRVCPLCNAPAARKKQPAICDCGWCRKEQAEAAATTAATAATKSRKVSAAA